MVDLRSDMSVKIFFQIDDTLKNGQSAGVDGFGAVEGEMGNAEVFSPGVGSIGGVVNNADIEGSRIKVDDGILGKFFNLVGAVEDNDLSLGRIANYSFTGSRKTGFFLNCGLLLNKGNLVLSGIKNSGAGVKSSGDSFGKFFRFKVEGKSSFA